MAQDSESRQVALGQANRRTGKKLFVVAALMFGFGYAMIPLYSVLCKVTGINGKTVSVAAVPGDLKIDTSRTVTVEFTGLANSGLPWDFKPAQNEITVHPGEVKTVNYIVRNDSAETVTGQAVPSVAPNRSARHFKKLECFCFTSQTLAAGESKEMPVRFYIDDKLPKDVGRVTLSYTFFNTNKQSSAMNDHTPGGPKTGHES
ncbi:MAG: cytochrome c oxidase assembly protein [Acidiferrobacterales bacterium]